MTFFEVKVAGFEVKMAKCKKKRGGNGTRVSWVFGRILEEKLGKLAVSS
jgi:hypothetical protein